MVTRVIILTYFLLFNNQKEIRNWRAWKGKMGSCWGWLKYLEEEVSVFGLGRRRVGREISWASTAGLTKWLKRVRLDINFSTGRQVGPVANSHSGKSGSHHRHPAMFKALWSQQEVALLSNDRRYWTKKRKMAFQRGKMKMIWWKSRLKNKLGCVDEFVYDFEGWSCIEGLHYDNWIVQGFP